MGKQKKDMSYFFKPSVYAEARNWATRFAKTKRTPEQRKRLQELRQENAEHENQRRAEQEQYLRKLAEGVDAPSTPAQRETQAHLKKLAELKALDETAIRKEQKEEELAQLMEETKMQDGFFGGAMNFLDGLFESDGRNKVYEANVNGKKVKRHLYMQDDGTFSFYDLDDPSMKSHKATSDDLKEAKYYEDLDKQAAKAAQSGAYAIGKGVGTGTSKAVNNIISDGIGGIVGAVGDGVRMVQGGSGVLEALENTGNSMGVGLWGVGVNLVEGIFGGSATINEQKQLVDLRRKELNKDREKYLKTVADEKIANGKGDSLFDKMDDYFDGVRDQTNNIDNVSAAIYQRARDLEGREQESFSVKNQEVSKEKYIDPKTGKSFDLETVDDPSSLDNGKASAWDIKTLALDGQGNVLFDSEGKPMYTKKNTYWNSAMSSNWGATSDKYFLAENVIPELMEMGGDIASTYLVGGAVGKAGKVASGTGNLAKVGAKALTPKKFSKALSVADAKIASTAIKTADRVIDGANSVKGAYNNTVGKVEDKLRNKMNLSAKTREQFKKIGDQDGLDAATAIGKQRAREMARNLTVAYIEGSGESDMIANQVKNDLSKEKVDKVSGINVQDIADEVRQARPELADEFVFQEAERIAQERRNIWAEANKEKFREIAAWAELGAEQARLTNNLGFITNLGQVSALLKNKKLSRNLLDNPMDKFNPLRGFKNTFGSLPSTTMSIAQRKDLWKAASNVAKGVKGAYNSTIGGQVVKQGFIEGVLEEGFLNSTAERAGLAAGRGEAYHIFDILDNIDSEFVENAYAGAIIGGGQAKLSSLLSLKSDRESYKEQQKNIKEMLELIPSAKENMKNLEKMQTTATFLKDLQEKSALLRANIKIENGQPVAKTKEELVKDNEEADQLEKESFIARLITAANMGTSGEVEKMLDNALSQEGLTPEEIKELQRAKNLNTMVSRVYDTYASTPGFDPNTMVVNRAHRQILEEQLEDIDEDMMEALSDAVANRGRVNVMSAAYQEGYNEEKEVLDIPKENRVNFSDGGVGGRRKARLVKKIAKKLGVDPEQKEHYLDPELDIEKYVADHIDKMEEEFGSVEAMEVFVDDPELLKQYASVIESRAKVEKSIKDLEDTFKELQKTYSKSAVFGKGRNINKLTKKQRDLIIEGIDNSQSTEEIEALVKATEEGNLDLAVRRTAELRKQRIRDFAKHDIVPNDVSDKELSNFLEEEAAKARAEQAREEAIKENERKEAEKAAQAKEAQDINEDDETQEALAEAMAAAGINTPTAAEVTGVEGIVHDDTELGGFTVGEILDIDFVSDVAEDLAKAIEDGSVMEIISLRRIDSETIEATVDVGGLTFAVELDDQNYLGVSSDDVYNVGDTIIDFDEEFFVTEEGVTLADIRSENPEFIVDKTEAVVIDVMPDGRRVVQFRKENGNMIPGAYIVTDKVTEKAVEEAKELAQDLPEDVETTLRQEFANTYGLVVGDSIDIKKHVDPKVAKEKGINSESKLSVMDVDLASGVVIAFDENTSRSFELPVLVQENTNSDLPEESTQANDIEESIRNAQQRIPGSDVPAKAMKTVVENMNKILGRKPTFRDFLQSSVDKYGEEFTFQNYSKLEAMWALTGEPAEDIYHDFFNINEDDLLAIMDQFEYVDHPEDQEGRTFRSLEEVRNGTIRRDKQARRDAGVVPEEDIAEDDIDDDSDDEQDFDVYNKGANHKKKAHSELTPAMVGVVYEEDKDGNKIDKKFNKGTWLDTSIWLNPRIIRKGVKLTVQPVENPDNILVTDWFKDNGVWKKNEEPITFGELVKRDKLEPGTPEYIARVPMVAHVEITNPETGELESVPAFAIADSYSVNPTRYEQSQRLSLVKEERAKLAELRSKAYAGGATIQIDQRNLGQFVTYVDMKDSGRTLSTDMEADPTAPIAIATDLSTMSINGEKVNVKDPNSSAYIINNALLKPGLVYSLRPVAYVPIDGDETNIQTQYVAIELLMPRPEQSGPGNNMDLNPLAFNNIKWATIARTHKYLENAVKRGDGITEQELRQFEAEFNINKSKRDLLASKFKAVYGVDIYNSSKTSPNKDAFNDLLNMFVKVFDGGKNPTSSYFNVLMNEGVNGQAYLFSSGLAMGINVKGAQQAEPAKGPDAAYGTQTSNSFALSTNTGQISSAHFQGITVGLRKMLSPKGPLTKVRFDPSIVKLTDGQQVLDIDTNGDTTDVPKSYSNYIKENTYTSVPSMPIEEPTGDISYVLDIQPDIRYSLVSDEEPKGEVKQQQKQQGSGQGQPIDPKKPVDLSSLEGQMSVLPEEFRDISFVGLTEITSGAALEGSIRELTPAQEDALAARRSNIIDGLSDLEQSIIVDGLYSAVLADLYKNKKFSTDNITMKAVLAPRTYLQPELDRTTKALEWIESEGKQAELSKVYRALAIKKRKLEAVLDNQDKLTSTIEGKKGDLIIAFEKFFKETMEVDNTEDDITKNEEEQDTQDGQVEHDHSGNLLTQDVKKSFTQDMYLFFSGIPRKDRRTKTSKVYFTNQPEYETPGAVIDALRSILVKTDPSYDDIVEALRVRAAKNPLYQAILDRFVVAPEHVQKQIMYKMVQDKLDMRYIMLDKSRGVTLKVHSANSDEGNIRLLQDWKQNFLQTNFFTVNDSNKVIVSKDGANKALEATLDIETRINEFLKTNKAYVNLYNTQLKTQAYTSDILVYEDAMIPEDLLADIQNYFTDVLGIEIDPLTSQEFIYRNMFNLTSKSNKGLIYFAKQTFTRANTLLTTNPDMEITPKDDGMDLHSSIGNITKGLAALDTSIVGDDIPKSFRLGGKDYQGTVQKTMVGSLVKKLRNTSSQYFQDLLKIPYSKGNYLLEALQKDPILKATFGIEFLGPEAIKEQGVKYDPTENRKINALPEADNILTEMGMFMHTEKRTNYEKDGVSFRIARMFMPALSDKAQMVVMKSLAVDLRSVDFNADSLGLSDDILNFMVSQLFDSEYQRMFTFYMNESNQKGFKKATQSFNSIGAFNNLAFRTKDGVTIPLTEAVKMVAENSAGKTEETLQEELQAIKVSIEHDIKEKLYNTILDQYNSTRETLTKQGIFRPKPTKSQTRTGNLVDSKYFDDKGFAFENTQEKWELEQSVSTMDFVINNLLHQNNVYQTILGDPAQFAKKGVNSDFFANGAPNWSKFLKHLKDLGENVTKRSAMLIAPGSNLANAKGDLYTQIFVTDPISISSAARALIQQYYGKVSPRGNNLLSKFAYYEERLSRDLQTGQDLKRIEATRDRLNLIRDVLAKEYPDIASYFSIEGTDAQEYTTWQEHMDILLRQGRLTKEAKDELLRIQDKLERGEDLSPNELKVVMNPIKPVYAGPHTDYAKNPDGTINKDKPIHMRTVYIKTSSFPLFPQLTKGLELDAVRDKMEKLQETRGQKVRLTYESGNKIGFPQTKLSIQHFYNTPFDQLYSTDDKGIAKGYLADAIMELDRENFKIQQDTPYKTEKFLKKNMMDYVTMGSQMWKILTGAGIANDNKKHIFPMEFDESFIDLANKYFKLEGEDAITVVKGRLTGFGLDRVKTFIEKEYFNNQKESLFDELGLEPDGTIINAADTKRALYNIISNELATGAYPDFLQDSVELLDGDLEFATPLWLTQNSNKFETLLQAIVTSRLIRIQLPGNMHISTSSEGFNKPAVSSLDELSNDVKSRIVWTKPREKNRELKPTRLPRRKTDKGKTYTEFEGSEVLVASRIRKTITVTKDDGTPVLDSVGRQVKKTILVDLTQEPYSYRDENGDLILNTEMMDDELLDMFSFRIPTSAHQSGAMLRVVGFLPEECGDMLIVPKEHTVQIGEDYDIDKRTLYKNHYTINKNGKIRKLNPLSSLEPIDAKEYAEAKLTFREKQILDRFLKDHENLGTFVMKSDRLNKLHAQKEQWIIDSQSSLDTISPYESEISELTQELALMEESLKETYKTGNVSEVEALKKYQTALNKVRKNYSEKIENFEHKIAKGINLKARQKAKQFFLEDAMVNMYKSVYMSPDEGMQKKINKTLSFQVAEDTANAIQNKLAEGVQEPYFTILSSAYQRFQMRLGMAGKNGIGEHSNAVTFQAQMERLVNKIKLSNPLTIGYYSSDGTLGRDKTLDGARDIADVHTENQNSATDNVKAQIMGKRNENSYTMSVLVGLTYRGFDIDTETGYQISSLLISQPSIRKYVELQEANKSIAGGNVAEFVIIKQLLNDELKNIPYETAMKYINNDVISKAPNGMTSIVDSAVYGISKGDISLFKKDNAEVAVKGETPASLGAFLTGQNLYDNLTYGSNPSPEGSLAQMATMATFFQVKGEMTQLNKARKLLNMNTSGLGMSYFDVLDRIELFRDLYTSNIDNIKDLAGEFKHSSALTKEEVDSKEWFVIDGIAIKPTTAEGIVLVNSLTAVSSVITMNYPYETAAFKTTLSTMQRTFNTKNLKRTKANFMRSFNDFIVSTNKANFFNGTTEEERYRLFHDDNNKGKRSLAHYLKGLQKVDPDFINGNALLKDFRYTVSLNGVSYIKHRSTSNASDKTFKHRSYLSMLQDDTTVLPPFNGEPMTPRKLALNLFNYATLSKNDQGATGFKDLLSVDVHKVLGVDAYLRGVDRALVQSRGTEVLARFLKQFGQHNPDTLLGLSKVMSDFDPAVETVFLDNTAEIITTASDGTPHVASKDNISHVQSFKVKTDSIYGQPKSLPPIIAEAYEVQVPVSMDEIATETRYAIFEAGPDLGKGFITYHRISPLGKGNYIEYNADNDVRLSSLPENTSGMTNRAVTVKNSKDEDILVDSTFLSNVRIDGSVEIPDGSYSLEQIFGVNPTAHQVFRKLMGIVPQDSRHRPLIEAIFGGLDVKEYPKIEFVDSEFTFTSKDGQPKSLDFGAYSYENHTIYISKDLMENAKKMYPGERDIEVVAEVFTEEMLHSIQKRKLAEWVDINMPMLGLVDVKPGAPAFVRSLVGMYEMAVADTDLQGKYSYELSTISEFMAHYYLNPEFRTDLDKALNSKLKKPFGQAFIDTIVATVRRALNLTTASDILRDDIDRLMGTTFKRKLYLAERRKEGGTAYLQHRVDDIMPRQGLIVEEEQPFFNLTGKTDFTQEDVLALVEHVMQGKPIYIQSVEDRKNLPDGGAGQAFVVREIVNAISEAAGEELTRYNMTKYFHKTSANMTKGGEHATEILTFKGIQNVSPISNYQNFSGGAYGGDTFFDVIGQEFGMYNSIHFTAPSAKVVSKDGKEYASSSRIASNTLRNMQRKEHTVTEERMVEAKNAILRLLKKDLPLNTVGGRLLIRDYFQAEAADAIFAVAPIGPKGYVEGGTSMAVDLTIKMGKPVYVWDLKTEKWYQHVPRSKDATKDWANFQEMNTIPVLTPRFAGVGSRKTQNYITKVGDKYTTTAEAGQYLGIEKEVAAKRAIRELYDNSVQKLRSELPGGSSETGTNTPTRINSSGFTQNTLPKDYTKVEVKNAEVFIGNPFSKEEADEAFDTINKAFKEDYPKQSSEDKFGKVRRSLYYSDTPYSYSGTTRSANESPAWLKDIVSKVEESLGVTPGYFDMALINEYRDGNQRIGFHTDNEDLLNNGGKVNPTVVTVSFGDTRTMVLKSMDGNEVKTMKMENGSVAVMGYNSQINYKHGIQQELNKSKRFSITLRHNATKVPTNPPSTPTAEPTKFKVGEKVLVGKKTKDGMVYTEYIVRGYDKTGEKVLLKNLDGTNKTGGGLKPSSLTRELPKNTKVEVKDTRKFVELNADKKPELKRGYKYYRAKTASGGAIVTYNTVIGKNITSKFKDTVLDIPGAEWIMIYDLDGRLKVIEESSGLSLPSNSVTVQKSIVRETLIGLGDRSKEDVIKALESQTSVYPKVVESEHGNPEDYTDANGQIGLAFSIRETFKLPKVNFC